MIRVDGLDSVLWVEPRTLDVIEDDGARRVAASGDTAVAVLSDVLARLPIGAALGALEALDDDPLVFLEALPRVTRVLLPASLRVVELRPGRDGRPGTARVESREDSHRILETRLRLESRAAEWLGPARALPGGALVLSGRLVVETVADGSHLPADRGAALLTAALRGATVEQIDDQLLDFVALLGRREHFGREVCWRLFDLGLDVLWTAGEGGVRVVPVS